MKDAMNVSPPVIRGTENCVALPARLAAKAAVYSAWRASPLSKAALGQKIGRSETEARRLLDPDYGTKLDQLGEAAAALGGRLSIAFTTAP
jgi:antitoxin HicB